MLGLHQLGEALSAEHPTSLRNLLSRTGTTSLRTALDQQPDVRQFCSVPDRFDSPTKIAAFGSPGGRWDTTAFTWSIDLTDAPADVATQALRAAFAAWENASGRIITFRQVSTNGLLHARFGGKEIDSRFGAERRALGSAAYPGKPAAGKLNFNKAEPWTSDTLTTVAIHEIGHALGLAHSNDVQSVMYPAADLSTAVTTVDTESVEVIQRLYGTRPVIPLSDRATSDRPALAASTQSALFSDVTRTLHMVWKGARDDHHFYESFLTRQNTWTAQRPAYPQEMSSFGPALTEVTRPGSVTSTDLLMAWRGVGDDGGLYVAREEPHGWGTPKQIPNVGSSNRPALAFSFTTHITYLAWKGARDDTRIYWSRLDPRESEWRPQEVVAGVGTSSSPALVVFNNELHMFWKGPEGDNTLWFTTLGPRDVWRPQRQVTYADYPSSDGGVPKAVGSGHGPAATAYGDRLLLSWRGSPGDQGIYYSIYDGTDFSGQLNVPRQGSSVGPALWSVNGLTFMAWKGIDGDNTIHWTAL